MKNKALKYYLIYKPFKMLSQFSKDNPSDITLADLDFKFEKDIYSAGRLDKDSEGLLLLSNDGALKHKLMNPKFEHSKTYWAQVDGAISNEDLDKIRKGGINIKTKKGNHLCKPAKTRILEKSEIANFPERNPPIRVRKNIPTSWIEIILKEGKNRQIRKMTAQIGFPTLRLIRVAIGNEKISHLKPGTVKEISQNKAFELLQ